MSLVIQNAVVFLLVAMAAVHVLIRIGRTLFRSKSNSACGGCSGCAGNASGGSNQARSASPTILPVEVLLERSQKL